MFEVAVNTRRAIVEQKELITTHSAGLQVRFTFSEDWDDLSRFAVFRNGEDGIGRAMLLASSNITIIPPEVCAEEYIDEPLFVGVYGTDGVGAIAIPTVWVSLGVLREGATTDGIITPPQPTPDMWAQMNIVANEAVSIASECEDGEEARNAAEAVRQSNEEQRQQNETARQAQFNQLKQNAIPYVLEPSASVIVYNPDAPAGQRIFPTTLSVDAYRIDSDGDRGGYTADVFWYTCTDGQGMPVAAETEYSTTGIYVTLPQTITDEATVEFYIQKNPEIGLPDTLARITVPIIKSGTKGDPGDDGFSPEVTITEITDGHRVTITDEDHPQGQSFDVVDGADGDDGYSPAVTITTITGGHRVTITDEDHPTGQSFDVMDGASDAGQVSYDQTQTYQVGTVGAELSDQKNAISQKAPLIINTASGDIASFADGADGMKIRKIVGTIVPVQSGTGDPSPDNVRPISGWTGANLYNTGENLFNKSTAIFGQRPNASGVMSESPDYVTSDLIPVKPNTSYYVNGLPVVHGYKKDLVYIRTLRDTSSKGSFIVPADCYYVRIRNYSSLTTDEAKQAAIDAAMLNYGTTEKSYEPYNLASNTLPINWQSEAGTIYGGTVTLHEDGSADVVATWAIVDLGTLSYNVANAAYGVYRASLPLMVQGNRQPNLLYCSHYPYSGIYALINIATNITDKSVGKRNGSNRELFIRDTSYISYTSEQFATAMSGVQVLYPLTEAQSWHIPNVGSIATYLGTNNVWIDTGSITECTYPADTKLYIDGLTAPDEDMIADANIASGKYFVVNNQLFLSTAAIAAGASIVPGTNCTATNLAEALNALNT